MIEPSPRPLPPEVQAQALHRPLPRNRRAMLIGALVTLLLHLLVVLPPWLRSRALTAPEVVFFVKLLPLPGIGPTGAAESGGGPGAGPGVELGAGLDAVPSPVPRGDGSPAD